MLGLILLLAGSGALLLQPSDDDGLLGVPELAVGKPAPRTVKAPRDFAVPDPDTTARLKQEAVRGVLPTYDLLSAVGLEAKARIERAFAEMSDAAHAAEGADAGTKPDPKEARAISDNFMRALQIYLDDRELEIVTRGGFSEEVRDAAIMVVRTTYEQRIIEDRDFLRVEAPGGALLRVVGPSGTVDHEEQLVDYHALLGLDQARASIDELVAKKLEHLSAASRRSVAFIAKRLLRPNVVGNPDETRDRAERAEAAVRPVIIPIKRGETVLRLDEPVTERQRMIVRWMADQLNMGNRVQPPIGGALAIVLLLLLAYRAFGKPGFLAGRDLTLVGSMILVSLVVFWVAYKGASWASEEIPAFPSTWWRFLAPVSLGAITVRTLVGKDEASALIVVAAVAAGLMMDESVGYLVYVLVGSLAAVAPEADPDRPGMSIFQRGLLAGLAQAFVLSALALLESRWVLDGVLYDVGIAIGSGILSALFTMILVPPMDVLFGYTSPFKMKELANLNHRLLRDLLVQAPGTYHHSIVVGALAEAGARAIGADPMLARVGGYYHDIGKLKNPRLFSENQRGGRPADEAPFGVGVLAVVDEAQGIKMHVTDGLELGAKHRLGQAILEIIAQHHGTSTIRRLEERAQSLGSMPPTGALRYAGPKPMSKEAALVLLADAVEAAADAMLASAPIEEGMLEAAIDRILREATAEGQLENVELTSADLKRVGAEFAVVLREILRRRGTPATSQRPASLDPRFVEPPEAGRPN
ncbi:MAG: HDIG domain-containing protein [Myxococcota bacterium]